MSMFHFCHLLLDHVQYTLIHRPNIPGFCAVLFLTALYFTFTTRHIHNWTFFPLWLKLFISSGAISPLFSTSILEGGVHLSVSYLLVILYCSWGSQDKKDEVMGGAGFGKSCILVWWARLCSVNLESDFLLMCRDVFPLYSLF